jgi:hypothetical protein
MRTAQCLDRYPESLAEKELSDFSPL